ALLLEAGEDLATQPALYGVRFQDDEGSFHARRLYPTRRGGQAFDWGASIIPSRCRPSAGTNGTSITPRSMACRRKRRRRSSAVQSLRIRRCAVKASRAWSAEVLVDGSCR